MKQRILIATLVSNAAYSMIAPFLPVEFEKKGVSPQMVGCIIAIYSLAVIACSPLVGSSLTSRFNKQHLITAGLTLMGIAFLLLGITSNIEDTDTLIYLSLLLRALQGSASAMIQTTCYSLATTQFPNEKEAMIGYIEAVMGIGLMMGPVIGAAFYAQLGFTGSFYMMGGLILLFVGTIVLQKSKPTVAVTVQEPLLPKTSPSNDQDNTLKQEIAKYGKVSVWDLLKSARFVMAGLTASLVYFSMTTMEPILAPRLLDFDLSPLEVGVFFAIQPFFYIPGSMLVQYVPKQLERRLVMIIASLLSFVGFLTVGPSQLFHLPDSLMLMAIGQAAAGITLALMMIPTLPEMIDSQKQKYPHQMTQVSDVSAGVYNTMLGIGQVTSPPFGSQLCVLYGFRITMDLVALIFLVLAVVYFVVAGGLNAIKETSENFKKETKCGDTPNLNDSISSIGTWPRRRAYTL